MYYPEEESFSYLVDRIYNLEQEKIKLLDKFKILYQFKQGELVVTAISTGRCSIRIQEYEIILERSHIEELIELLYKIVKDKSSKLGSFD